MNININTSLEEKANEMLNQCDVVQAIHVLLNEHARRCGESYIACFLKPSAFDETGHLRNGISVNDSVAKHISETIKERGKIVTKYVIDRDNYAMSQGLILSA